MLTKGTFNFYSLQEYRTGKLLTGEVKKILIDVLVAMVERHRRARAAVTEEVCYTNCFLFVILAPFEPSMSFNVTVRVC